MYYFFYLLTFDTSPCLQKSIIYLVTKFISDFSYDNFVKMFDKKRELFDIVLYVFKTSIFDVKIDALNLLFLIEEKTKETKNFDDFDKQIFLKKEIIPIFLIDEINNLPSNNNQEKKKNENDDNSLNINDKEKTSEENNKKEETKENEDKQNNSNDEDDATSDLNNEKINQIIEEKKEKLKNEIKKDTNAPDEEKIKYGIKSDIDIEGVKYFLYSPSQIQKKINQKYNKQKFNSLINSLYEKIIFYFNNNDINLNFKLELLLQIVSKGDLLLIQPQSPIPMINSF